jgi:Fe-S-cluster containining protein
MKRLDEKEALARLGKIKNVYRDKIRPYETKAKDCQTCETRGACCLDAHFVNVHITRLEAVAMRKVLNELDEERRIEINEKISQTIEKYNLEYSGNTFAQTYACPLFEKETGCLVHAVKPVPCIQHACYERREDLPPDKLQEETEDKIERLNQQTYNQSKWLPLPIWLEKL